MSDPSNDKPTRGRTLTKLKMYKAHQAQHAHSKSDVGRSSSTHRPEISWPIQQIYEPQALRRESRSSTLPPLNRVAEPPDNNNSSSSSNNNNSGNSSSNPASPAKTRNLTRIRFLQQAHANSRAGRSEKSKTPTEEHTQSIQMEERNPFLDPVEEPSSPISSSSSSSSKKTTTPQFRHSIFHRPAMNSPNGPEKEKDPHSRYSIFPIISRNPAATTYSTVPEEDSEYSEKDYFSVVKPSQSEATSGPSSTEEIVYHQESDYEKDHEHDDDYHHGPETSFDVNLEDPRQGLLFLKPPVPKRERSGAEALKRRTRAMSIAYIEYATSAVNSFRKKNHQPDDVPVPSQKYQKVIREKGHWYSNWSTRRVILLSTSTLILIVFAVGLTLGLLQRAKSSHYEEVIRWKPAIGTTWQIQLSEPISNPSYRAYVYDIDYFDNNATAIANLHSMGRRVICHFSAGTYETWQHEDTTVYTPSMLGNSVIGWGIERWLDIRQDAVKKIMANRIVQAKANGCDGITPDNINVYSVDNSGFNITQEESKSYVRYLAGLAQKQDMAVGLINAPELIEDTLDVIDFGMNEGCAANNGCEAYRPFIQAGKPVFHIEYSSGTAEQDLTQACGATGTEGFSTLVKKAVLDAWALECPVTGP